MDNEVEWAGDGGWGGWVRENLPEKETLDWNINPKNEVVAWRPEGRVIQVGQTTGTKNPDLGINMPFRYTEKKVIVA